MNAELSQVNKKTPMMMMIIIIIMVMLFVMTSFAFICNAKPTQRERKHAPDRPAEVAPQSLKVFAMGIDVASCAPARKKKRKKITAERWDARTVI